MNVYRCDLTLHDYLFFATTERGKIAETGPFVHNYALTYALGWAVAPRYHATQEPHYETELAQVGKRYITPAELIVGETILSQYNTKDENFRITSKKSIGYPDWGFIKCFRPGSIFRAYVISGEAISLPPFTRLGKFMAKTKVSITQANQVEHHTHPWKNAEKELSHSLLNWKDLLPQARPQIFDIISTALPSHLIANPLFDDQPSAFLHAHFERNAVVELPLLMGYFGGNVCASW